MYKPHRPPKWSTPPSTHSCTHQTRIPLTLPYLQLLTTKNLFDVAAFYSGSIGKVSLNLRGALRPRRESAFKFVPKGRERAGSPTSSHNNSYLGPAHGRKVRDRKKRTPSKEQDAIPTIPKSDNIWRPSSHIWGRHLQLVGEKVPWAPQSALTTVQFPAAVPPPCTNTMPQQV